MRRLFSFVTDRQRASSRTVDLDRFETNSCFVLTIFTLEKWGKKKKWKRLNRTRVTMALSWVSWSRIFHVMTCFRSEESNSCVTFIFVYFECLILLPLVFHTYGTVTKIWSDLFQTIINFKSIVQLWNIETNSYNWLMLKKKKINITKLWNDSLLLLQLSRYIILH